MKRELAVWLRVSHPNIVPFVGIIFGLDEPEEGHDESVEEVKCPSLVSLWMENGTS